MQTLGLERLGRSFGSGREHASLGCDAGTLRSSRQCSTACVREPALALRCKRIGTDITRKCRGLDGFVIEIRGEELCSTLEAFGESVRIVLKTLSDIDPAGAKYVLSSYDQWLLDDRLVD